MSDCKSELNSSVAEPYRTRPEKAIDLNIHQFARNRGRRLCAPLIKWPPSNVTLRRLIERAYSVKLFQVTGPDWMESIHFDMVAKYPPDTKPDDRSAMLRTLLEDRSKLSVHRESKNLPGYELLMAKKIQTQTACVR